ncbi:MAG TPA: hypothetical protein ENG03_07405 [Thioploca sp.]|nr:MAG: hypothetical protein DRR19_12175 [Gammaproteobacteria bacterium]HDN26907.1 hypothetical protein [Thioploca sp.]
MPKSGKEHGEVGKQYEVDVREKTGGQSEIIDDKEIDSVTDEALIQAKDSNSAIYKPQNFLNKKTRNQIKNTIKMAAERNKHAEFWFKKEPHPDILQYIEEKGGKVIVWSKE